MMGVMVSPLRGADGNVEFLAHLASGRRSTVPPTRQGRSMRPWPPRSARATGEANDEA